MIRHSIIRRNPIPKKYRRQLFFTWLIKKRIKPVDFVNYSDVYHTHYHYPKVEYILKKHKLCNSFILCGKHSLEDMLECEHPTAVHEVCDVHILLLKRVDEVDEAVISVFDCLVLGAWEGVDVLELVDGKVYANTVVANVVALSYLTHKEVVHEPGVEDEAYGEGEVS